MSAKASFAVPDNPFPGLRPFREDEEYLFFGRENQIDAMVDKLAATRFLSVVGGSGSGKSSLVNCGLRPALHRGLMPHAGTSWRMAQFRPGSNPLKAMAESLSEDGVLFSGFESAGGLSLTEIVDTTLRMSKLGLTDIYEQANLGENVNLLVVVDQFEELFRYRQIGADEQEKEHGISEEDSAFVNLLLEAKKQTSCPIYVVLTMRSDFLGDCAHFPGLVEAVNAGQYLVPRMTRDERRAAITGPAVVGGAEISPVLLTRLVNDVGDNPDQLSILQHALNRTWARWQQEGSADEPLDLPHYEAIGAMAHALDQHAEEAYDELDGERQHLLCEKLFKALTDKATDPRGVRRPTTLGSLCALAADTQTEVKNVIEVFRDPDRSFLMPPSGTELAADTVVDISHESLMRVWERLKTWADEEARSASIYSRLAGTAELHQAGNAGLLRGPELQLASKWHDQNQPNEFWAQRYHHGFTNAIEYLKKSNTARLRRRWSVAGITFLIFAVLTGFLVYAVLAEKDASRQAIIARAVGAKDLLDTKPSNGLIAAIVSGDEAREAFSAEILPAEIRSGYVEALQVLRAGGVPRNVWSAHNGEIVTSVAMSDDAQTIVTGGWDSEVRLWDHEGNPIDIPPVIHKPGVETVAISSDGSTIVSTGADGVWILDPKVGKPERLSMDGPFSSVSVNANGKLIALAGESGTIVIDRNGKLVSGMNSGETSESETSVSISGDGRTVLRSTPGKVRLSDENGKELWKAHTEEERDLDRNRNFGASSAAISRDGQMVAIGYRNGYVRLFDRNGKPMAKDPEEGSAHEGKVKCIAVSTDGKTIVSGGEEGTVMVWNRRGKPEGPPLTGHDGDINAVGVSGDGKSIVSVGDDGMVRLWERYPKEVPVKSYEGEVSSIAFSRDGQTILAAGPSAQVLRLDRDKAPDMQTPTGNSESGGPAAEVTASAWGPGGEFQVIGYSDGNLRLRRLQGTIIDKQFKESHKSAISSIAVSGDGNTIISGDEGGTIRLWDSEGGPTGKPAKGHEGRVASVALNSDGRTIVSGGADGKAVQWDPAGPVVLRQLIATYSTGMGETVAVSPDGQIIVSGSERGMIGLFGSDGRVISVFKGHEDNVSILAFGPDQELIVSADDSGTVHLWDRRGRAVGKSFNGNVKITSLALNHDGTTLVSGDSDGNIMVRQIGLETFLREACDWLKFHHAFKKPDTDVERKAAKIAESLSKARAQSNSSDGKFYVWKNDGKNW